MVHGIIRLFARSRESTVKSKGIHGATVETWMPNSGCRFCCHLSAHILGIQSCRRMQMMSRHGGANRILRYELLEFNVGSRLASRVCFPGSHSRCSCPTEDSFSMCTSRPRLSNVSKPIGTRHHGTMLQPTIVRWLGTNVSMVPTRDVLMVWRQLGMNVLRDEGFRLKKDS